MQKIMFNDKYGLTQAVLDGRKTQTRRIITIPKTIKGIEARGYVFCRNAYGVITNGFYTDADVRDIEGGEILPKYKVGEVVPWHKAIRSVEVLIMDPRWDIIAKPTQDGETKCLSRQTSCPIKSTLPTCELNGCKTYPMKIVLQRGLKE